jgi:triacylglycerol lipase
LVSNSGEPIFGSIEGYAPLIEKAVQRVELATSAPPLIVAHSMGGLAVRAWLCADRAEPRVRRVVTIGTPHRGTLLAHFALGLNGRQMRLTGEWLGALGQRETVARFSLFTCFYSHCDNIILPTSSATLPGADNRHVEGVAHVHLVRQDVVFDEVLRLALHRGHRPERDVADTR